MSAESKPNTGTVIVRSIIGIVLMVAGMFVSNNFHGVWETLTKATGVPLDLGKTIATIGVLIRIFPIVRVFFIDPLREAIENRTNELERTFSEAENLRAEMTTLKSDYEKRLAATEASAREQIQAQIREAQQMRQQLMSDASQQAEEMKKRALDEISAERDRIIADLRLQTVNLTLAATERILGENVDDARNRKLIEEFIDKAEVPA